MPEREEFDSIQGDSTWGSRMAQSEETEDKAQDAKDLGAPCRAVHLLQTSIRRLCRWAIWKKIPSMWIQCFLSSEFFQGRNQSDFLEKFYGMFWLFVMYYKGTYYSNAKTAFFHQNMGDFSSQQQKNRVEKRGNHIWQTKIRKDLAQLGCVGIFVPSHWGTFYQKIMCKGSYCHLSYSVLLSPDFFTIYLSVGS